MRCDDVVGDPAPDPLPRPPDLDGALRAALSVVHSARVVGVVLSSAIEDNSREATAAEVANLPGIDFVVRCLPMAWHQNAVRFQAPSLIAHFGRVLSPKLQLLIKSEFVSQLPSNSDRYEGFPT